MLRGHVTCGEARAGGMGGWLWPRDVFFEILGENSGKKVSLVEPR